MNLKIPAKGAERFYTMLTLFAPFKPFNALNNRERQVLSELLYIDHELRQLDEKKRDRLIFDYDTRREISHKLGVTTNSVYNIMSSLKKKGFIGKGTMRRDLKYVDEINIQFVDG